MRVILIMPKNSKDGNLVWGGPYIYPKDHLHQEIEQLTEKGFFIELLEDQSGIAFRSDFSNEETINNLRVAFRWMDIVLYDNEDEIDEGEILKYAIVALPLGRLKIEEPILSDHICLLPAGDLLIYNLRNLDGSEFGTKNSILRDFITKSTKVSIEVFQNMPLMVFTIKMQHEEYLRMNQTEDNDLISKCSERAERVMDLIRFYGADYVLQEWLPSKPGIWNDRYSAMWIFFPKEQVSHIQSREVELKSFIKGIGMEFDNTDLNMHPLMSSSLNELQRIIVHALRLNSAIQEADNETMKFAQIMMLLEYIGNPYKYENFKHIKAQLIPVLAKDKEHYHKLSHRFLQLTKGCKDANGNDELGLRTNIVHLGKSILDLVPVPKERKALFQELHGYVHALLHHMMFSHSNTWKEYEIERLTPS